MTIIAWLLIVLTALNLVGLFMLRSNPAMIKAAEKVAILAISEKLNSSMQMKIADVDEIHYLITEQAPEAPELQAYKSKNLTIL